MIIIKTKKTFKNQDTVIDLINGIIKIDKSFLILNTLMQTKNVYLSNIKEYLNELNIKTNKCMINELKNELKHYNINLINDIKRTYTIKPSYKNIDKANYQLQQKQYKRILY